MHKFIRMWALVAVLIGTVGSAWAATPSEFYLGLLRRGTGSYEASRYTDAQRQLRIAAFGLVEAVEQYQLAQVYLTLTYDKLSDPDRAREAAHRVVLAERVERKYAGLTLPAEVRTAFETTANKLLSSSESGMLLRGGPCLRRRLPSAPCPPRHRRLPPRRHAARPPLRRPSHRPGRQVGVSASCAAAQHDPGAEEHDPGERSSADRHGGAAAPKAQGRHSDPDADTPDNIRAASEAATTARETSADRHGTTHDAAASRTTAGHETRRHRNGRPRRSDRALSHSDNCSGSRSHSPRADRE